MIWRKKNQLFSCKLFQSNQISDILHVLCRRRFFYNDKSWNSKRYLFANVKSFCHLMWKRIYHSGGVNSILTNLQTFNLWTGQYVSYKSESVDQFWFNLPHNNDKMSNVKNFSHLKIDIFCYFNFCHWRRNAFCWIWLQIAFGLTLGVLGLFILWSFKFNLIEF